MDSAEPGGDVSGGVRYNNRVSNEMTGKVFVKFLNQLIGSQYLIINKNEYEK